MDCGGDGISRDGFRNEYVANLRVRYPPCHGSTGVRRESTIRAIARSTTPEPLNWSELEDIDLWTGPRDYFCTDGIKAWYRAPPIFLGFPRRFVP